ncbi:D-amino-acid oxidase-like isoform X1 [Haliotis rubra]|uniref:D-amino-acid oxidase-like isoform X1 n=1 Tax=Haliotis rubra TaxID=36100 RepID=UPI001EE621D7|nr:D-amino-acid oxidase-like isoform X1 [Haliotis rubra]
MVGKRVCVIGAGVSGLASAVCVQRQCPNVEVTLVADVFSPKTTSDVSGGFWEPYCLGDTPKDLIKTWSSVTWDYLLSIYNSPVAQRVGCQLMSGFTLTDGDCPDPDFKDQVFGFRQLTADELKQFPMARNGSFHTSVQIDVELYLQWLMERFTRQGGRVQQRKVESLEEMSGQYDVVVNCTGMGSCTLMRDTSLKPVRGQVLRMQAPWVKHFYLFISSKAAATYMFPSCRSLVVGGVAQEGNWNEDVDEADSRDIHERALLLMPSLKGVKIESVRTGLRPARTQVRLEAQHLKMRSGETLPVVHNYGHGGAGVTLHWGCAQHTARLVKEALTASKL